MNPIITIKLKNGKDIKCELYPEIAQNTVNNFISLIKKGFYNGIIFHRVIPGFVIQAGCPEKTGTSGAGYTIEGEFKSNGHKSNDLKHSKGVLSMARSALPNSASSQFFIAVDNAYNLDGEYAGFGKVLEGIENAEEIAHSDRDQNDRPYEDQEIETITIETFGEKYDDVKKYEA